MVLYFLCALINEHKIIWGYNIARKGLLIYVIVSQALLSVLQITHFIMLLTCDGG